MEKEQILEVAQKNKNRGQEYEHNESVKGSLMGTAVALLVGVVLFLIEYFIASSVNVGLIAVGITASGVQWLYEGIKIKKLYFLIIGVMQLLIAIFAILIFAYQVVVA